MKRNEYLKRAFDLLNSGKITEETYDTMICNIDEFTEDEDELENYSEDYFD
jgi:tetrahydromethanopterin S-methyltransferase subunit B